MSKFHWRFRPEVRGYQLLKITANLLMARTFGVYLHSGWNGVHTYAKYRWRGRVYSIPTSHDEDEG